MNGVDQQIPRRFDGDFRIQTVMQEQPQHGARIRVGKPGSSVPDRSEMNTLEQKLDFSCLASSFEFI